MIYIKLNLLEKIKHRLQALVNNLHLHLNWFNPFFLSLNEPIPWLCSYLCILPGSRCVKVPMTKSSVEMASTASSSSWSLTIHLTPARLIPSKASSTAADMPRTAHWSCRPSTSATDSEKPVMYMAPATHCKRKGCVAWKGLWIF